MTHGFLPARAWRARALIAAGVLLAPLAARVLWLEHAWAARDVCLVREAHVTSDNSGYRVLLGIDLSAPDCRFTIDGSPLLATKEEARRRAAAFPLGGTVACHRPPGLCGAALERAHVAVPFWIIPIASLVLLVAGALGLRRPPAPTPRHAGPFRMPPPNDAPPREPLVLRLPGPGLLSRIGAAIILLAPGVLGAPAMIWSFWEQPLDTIGFPTLVLVMATITLAMLTTGVYALFGRRRLVLDGSGLAAYRGAGIGSLDFRRVYASFSAWPTASIEPVHATGRFGARHVVGFTLVLSDGRSTLRADGFSDVKEAEAAAARFEHHRPA